MSNIIVTEVDGNGFDDCPISFCIIPSASLVAIVVTLKHHLAQIELQATQPTIEIGWQDGIWHCVTPKLLSNITHEQYRALHGKSMDCTPTDQRLIVTNKSICFKALFDGAEIMTHDIPITDLV
ncbi:hypothetical protein D3C87_351260 [compost metagenome]